MKTDFQRLWESRKIGRNLEGLIKLLMIFSVVVAVAIALLQNRPGSGSVADLKVIKVVESPILSQRKAEAGHKFVTVYFKLNCNKDLPFPIVPSSFSITDSEDNSHQPLNESSLFVEEGKKISLKKGDKLESSITFEIPQDVEAERLHLKPEGKGFF